MTILTFPYKKYYPIPPTQDVTIGADQTSIPPLIQNAPNWLNMWYAPEANPGTGWTFTFQIKASVADTLPVGRTTASFNIRSYFGTIPGPYTSVLNKFKVHIDVEDTILLTLSPSDMAFNYFIGDPTPATQSLLVESENNWIVTKDESWITLSGTAGINTGNIDIGVDPTGLSVGVYTGIVTVDDGLFQRTVNVTLIVTGEDTPSDFLTVSPLALEFVETLATAPTQQRNLSVDASEEWTTVISDAWLLLDTENAGAGITPIIATVDSIALVVGTYNASVIFSTATITKTLYVVLRITEVTTGGIVSGNLYFADDRNILAITNTEPNTYALLDFITTTALESLQYLKKTPFFRALASVLIGTETENLLEGNSITDNLATRVFSPLSPISLDFKVYDKNLFNNTTVERQAFVNVKFLNGKTPSIADKLTYLPDVITTTKDAIIALSFINEDAPTSIEITGDVTESIPVAITATTVYTAIINLSDFVLVAGNSINIAVGDQDVDVIIKGNEAEHTLLGFENEWQLPEYVMLTGKLKITSGKGWLTTKVDNNGDEHEKILEAKHPITFTVNSGFIYSQEEADWLDRLFESKKMYLYINAGKVEVVPTVSRLISYETRNHLVSYNLSFKKAIV